MKYFDYYDGDRRREREREREREEEKEREEQCIALQIASMRLALASVLPETLSRKQLC